MKLIIGLVVTLALLLCSTTYLLLIKWPSIKPSAPPEAPQAVETELLRSGDPTRTDHATGYGYTYEVRFYGADDNEAADVAASIRNSGPSQPQYELMVTIAHPVESYEIMLDTHPPTTHVESLSLTFNFSRRIDTFPFYLSTSTFNYALPEALPEGVPEPPPRSVSLESRIVERGVFLLNFTQLRNLENPPTSPERWSWISFQFLMTPESPYFGAFTLEISFTLHRVLDGGKLLYEKGTTEALQFHPPARAASSTSWPRDLLAPESRHVIACSPRGSVHF